MLKYINEAEYKKLLGTENVPQDFNKLVIEASNYIDYHTYGRIDKNNIPEQVKYVTCLIVDLINKAENKKEQMGNLKSQNIEGWQESYISPEEIDKKLEEDKYSTLKAYLWKIVGTDEKPLLYCGVC